MENTKDKGNDSEFPGYPHYPAKEDIMNSGENERIPLDVENLSRSSAVQPDLTDVALKSASAVSDGSPGADDDAEKAEDTGDTDITQEDLIALGDESSNFQTVDTPVENDLDVPGAEEDDANEEIGEEDEENNYYSIGGDNHENLEEDRGD